MLQRLADSIGSILYGLVAIFLGYCGRLAQEWLRASWQRRRLGQFFGIPDARVTIVHGAIYDPERQAFNFAAADQQAARSIAELFNQFHLREGKDFDITFEPDPRSDTGVAVAELSEVETARYQRLWSRNVVLIGGPRRNAVLDSLAPHLKSLALQITLERSSRKTLLYHTKLHQQLVPPRDDPSKGNGESYDYALVASLPNPHNLNRRLVILAGIHGTGTLAAGGYVSNLENLTMLNKRARNRIIAEGLVAKYEPGDERPTSVELI